jgi:predicted nucleic acid-binding Zn ribbon protein
VSGDTEPEGTSPAVTSGKGIDSERAVHSSEGQHQDELDRLSPDSGDSSTASCAKPEPTDMAADALQRARAISSGLGGPADVSRAGRQLKRRRRRRYDGPSYSGARPDERDPATIGAIVGQALPELGWVAPLAEARLMGQWATVVGPEIAARCHPVSLVDGELKVSAESTAWATQLRMMAPQILARITADLPRGLVKKILITGPAAPSWKHGPWSSRGRGPRDTYG